MNDRFKFRVWDKEQNKYLPLESLDDVLDMWISIDNTGVYLVERDNNRDVAYFNDITEDVIVQQCTGLKDKNGSLIYEGDIVRSDFEFVTKTVNPFLFKVGDVVFQNLFGGFAINSCRNAAPFQQAQLGSVEAENCEVIGNIYENKELLE